MNRNSNSYNAFLVVFVMVAGVLVLSSYWVITFVYRTTDDDNEIQVDDARSAIYIDYYANAGDYVSDDAYLAMGQYAGEFPEPQNVQVLEGLTTVEITGYMLNHFSAGMGVNCTYCHTLADFSAEEWDDEVAMANRNLAREHLQMTADLNQNWLVQLAGLTDDKQPSGAQITCATCHNGAPQFETWPDDSPVAADVYRLPLGEDVVFSVDEQGILNVNARDDISLDAVQYNQQVMYHMNTSLGVGCTHCHNSRYFPTYDGVPAKHYSLNMLQMSQYLWQNYADVLNEQEPSCNMCHQGAAIPPGAARSAEVMPAPIASPQE